MQQVTLFVPHRTLGALPAMQQQQAPRRLFTHSTAAVARAYKARAAVEQSRVGSEATKPEASGEGIADRIANIGPVGILGVVAAAAVVGYLLMRK